MRDQMIEEAGICELTDRDRQVVTTLTQKVRLLSSAQIVSSWWGATEFCRRAARRRLKRLCDAGWLLADIVNVHPLLPLEEPMFVWCPGQPPPACQQLAGRMRRRWTEPLVRMRVHLASRQAADHWGGFGGRHRHRTQLTHDLHQAEIYLRLRGADPERAGRWVGEDVLDQLRDGGKLPDAVIMAADGQTPQEVVEFGGTYDAARIRSFHWYCAERALAYQLW